MLVEHCVRLVASGERFVYAYYPGVDNVAHEFGLHNGFYERELEFADRLVGDLLTSLPRDTVLVVTADHGQIHLERDDWIDLGSLRPMVDVMAGDGRFRYLYARQGRGQGARGRGDRSARRRTPGCARAREVLDDGWIGTGATGTIPGRLGDVVLASRDASAFVDPALPVEVRLRSGHGSLTADEMYVPLVAGADELWMSDRPCEVPRLRARRVGAAAATCGCARSPKIRTPSVPPTRVSSSSPRRSGASARPAWRSPSATASRRASSARGSSNRWRPSSSACGSRASFAAAASAKHSSRG